MNYIGSKFSLLSEIEEVFNAETKGMGVETVVDIFAGTSAVGRHFKKLGFQVIGNDLQEYSYALGKHYIENNSIDELDLEYFDMLNNLEGVEGFIYQNYAYGSGSGRMYYSDHNCKMVDAARIKINEDFKNGIIDERNYYFYLASILESIDKRANTASVYGSFLKKLKKSAQKDVIFEPCEIIESSKNNLMMHGDANINIKKIKGDVLYMDPPYNSRQYSSNYHVLETIAKYDNPKIHGKTGVRSNEDHLKSDYSKKREAVNALRDIISNADFKLIIMSYNNEGIITLDEIESIMREFGDYKQYKKEYKKFKSQRSQKDDTVYEYLHVLRKKNN